MPLLPSQRRRFDIPSDVAYLNCAYLSPIPDTVRAAGVRGVEAKAQPWKITAPDFFKESEQLRAAFARLTGADAGDVAIIPAASYGIATAAAALPLAAGQSIALLAEEFPSNVYAWREKAKAAGGSVVMIERAPEGTWTDAVLAALQPGVAIASLPACHWTDGSTVDLVAVGARCREIGAALVVDATQSLGAAPFSIAEVQPDFLVCAAYKWLLGPYSLGLLYAHPRHHGAAPIEHNWQSRAGSEDFAGLVRYRDEFAAGARRFDVGERSNFALVPMALAGLGCLEEWGVESIAETLGALTERIADEAEARGLTVPRAESRSKHLIGLKFSWGMPPNLSHALQAAKVYVSLRGETLRVSPHLYNSAADIDRLFAVIDRFH